MMRTRAETVALLVARDGNMCGICGLLIEGLADIDHIKPRRHGGDLTDADNLQLTHPRCNRSKADAWNGQPASRERVMHDATLHIKVPADLLDSLTIRADREHMSRSEYIRNLLIRHVNRTAT